MILRRMLEGIILYALVLSCDPLSELPPSVNTYMVTFNKNDVNATGTMEPQIIPSGSSANLNLNTFINPGWAFAGWATTELGLVIYPDGASYAMGNQDVTLYAKWATPRIVTFDSQGGTPVPPQTVADGNMAFEPVAPTKTANALEGWFKEAGCINRWDFTNDLVTADITLYAKWLVCSEGLQFTLINNNTEYSVVKGTANTSVNIIIPEYWAGKKVTAIGNHAFSNCVILPGITIPSGIASIGFSAFSSCGNLTSITLPDGITTIGSFAFSHCTKLSNLTLPSSLTYIDYKTFEGCDGLTSIVIPEGVTGIGDSAFSFCDNLSSVTIPSTVLSIGREAFRDTNLESVTIPNGVTAIREWTFYNCIWLESVVLPNSVTAIRANAFRNCYHLVNFNLPENLQYIGDEAFESCGFASISLCDKLISIEDYAFRFCDDLVTVTINRVNPPLAGLYIFSGCTSLSTIRVPSGSVDAYKAANGWKNYSELIISQ